METGAVVLSGLFTILDPEACAQLEPDEVLQVPPEDVAGKMCVDPAYKRVAEVILGVLSGNGIVEVSVGRRSGPAYFSDKATASILSAGDAEELGATPTREAVDAFVAGMRRPVLVTKGDIETRKNVANGLNSVYGAGAIPVFEPMTPGREAFLIAETVFNFNTPLLTKSFGNPDVGAFLIIAAGKSTIHWIVYNEQRHYVSMAKARDAKTWAYSYDCIVYDPNSEDDRIHIALKTASAVRALAATLTLI